jgi:alkylation response protein AidB-like acyl-CoA dehydrogenase
MPALAPDVEALVAKAAALAPLVQRHADEGERERRLTPAVVDALEAAGLFRIFLPERFGGAGLDYTGGMPVIEEVAAADGSAGWNLAIGAGTLSFALLLDDDGAIEEILKTPRALCAGSINPMALRVIPEDGGYRVQGRLQYASGVTQSRWLVAGGLVFDGEKPRFLPSGAPALRGAFFPTADARVLDTWRVSGLSGTGSHDVEVADVFVPAARTWDFLGTEPKRHDPLAAISLPSRLGVSLVAVGLGILRHALDELVALAAVKSPFTARGTLLRERAGVQIDVARAAGLLDGARAHVRGVCSELFARVREGAAPAPADLARLRLAYVTATEQLLRGIELVRGAAGMNAIQTGSPIERCWRDLHAVSQHFALGTAHYERIGKIRLGLDPGPGPI